MKKKSLALIAIVALLAVAVIGGTLAYFTDTDDRENTFTFGKVDITLTETSDEADGTTGKATDDGFKYDNILPGLTYAKEPVITVERDSLNSYVFAELVVKDYHKLYAALGENIAKDLSTLLDKAKLSGEPMGAWIENENEFHIVFTNGVMKAEDTWTLFTGIKVPEGLTQEQVEELGTVTLGINGYAIQADGMNDAKAAWDAVSNAVGGATATSDVADD